jgi:methylmalonyl-CoA/ethylmalonyl-CoA epimerase
MARKIHHLGIAVSDAAEVEKVFTLLLGAPPYHTEDVPAQKARTVCYRVGESILELTSPMSDDSTVAKFLSKRGEGLHHVAIEVDDIVAEMERLRKAGFQLVSDTPGTGAGGVLVAFIHPRSTRGVLVELVQPVRDAKAP